MKILKRPARSFNYEFRSKQKPPPLHSDFSKPVRTFSPQLHLGLRARYRLHVEASTAKGKGPSTSQLLAALKASSTLRDYNVGKAVQLHAAEDGEDSNIYVATAVVSMLVKCGSLIEAERVFDTLPVRSVASWTALIQGYAENGDGRHAFELFERMRPEGCEPDAVAYVAGLKACICLSGAEVGTDVNGRLVKVAALNRARDLHAQAVNSDLDSELYVASSLVELYGQCGRTQDARRVFEMMESPDIVAWTSLIQAHVENGEPELALETFTSLASSSGLEPDARTYVMAFKSCSSLAVREECSGAGKLSALGKGMEIHSHAVSRGVEIDTFIGTVLIDMYSKCGSLLDTRLVFDTMKSFNVITLSSLTLAYSEGGESELALELLFHTCLDPAHRVLTPDAWTFAAALKACGNTASLQLGKRLQGEVFRLGLETEDVMTTCMLDVYCKCGDMESAQQVFEWSSNRDSVTWTAMLAGYSHRGEAGRVFQLFHEMVEEGVEAVEASFVCVLSVCSHAGLAERGREFLRMMKVKYGVEPRAEHYHCMVDLLSRGNELEEAVALVKEMPYEACAVAWRTVLGGCSKWKNVEVAKVAFEYLVKVDEKDATGWLYTRFKHSWGVITVSKIS